MSWERDELRSAAEWSERHEPYRYYAEQWRPTERDRREVEAPLDKEQS